MKVQINMKTGDKFVLQFENLERFQEILKQQEIIWQNEKNGVWVNQQEISSIFFEKDEENTSVKVEEIQEQATTEEITP